MKKNATIVTLIASGLAAAVVGLAAPASADIGHHDWAVGAGTQSAQVPSVSTQVHQSH